MDEPNYGLRHRVQWVGSCFTIIVECGKPGPITDPTPPAGYHRVEEMVMLRELQEHRGYRELLIARAYERAMRRIVRQLENECPNCHHQLPAKPGER